MLDRSAAPRDRRFALVATLLALAAVLAAVNLRAVLDGASFWSALFAPDMTDMRDVLVHDSLVPRVLVTLLCGAALGLAGALMQQVLRNPLAEPMTLGVFPGAYLALMIAGLWMPGWLAAGRETVAFAGGALAMLAVFALAWSQRMSSLGVILSGMVVNLYCGAISLAIAVVHFDLLTGLMIWGGGALEQTGWQPTVHLFASFVVCALGAALLYRPLSLFDAGDSTVRNLGASVGWMRFGALLIAVMLTTVVVSEVGVIGFVGLAAPLVAKLAGARRLRERLLWAPLTGAAMLWFTDEIVRVAASAEPFSAHLIPTGTVTSIVGVPLLVALLPRLRSRPDLSAPLASPLVHRSVRTSLFLCIALLALVCALSLTVARGPHGWYVASFSQVDTLLFWRVPRLLCALAAGVLLALAGTLLQRVTANPMASPDLLGVSSGGMLGIVAVLFATGSLSPALLFAGCVAGALVTLGTLFWFGRRAAFAPERLLLTGIAISALFQAVVGALMSSGDPRAGVLIDLLVGSTYYVAPAIAWSIAALAAMALVIAPLTARWMTALSLGAPSAASVGVPVARARFALLLFAALSSAAATVIVGPLSFIGLIAPHIARLSGGRRPLSQMYLAAALGALLMVCADWLGRQLVFPEEIAAGLVATLLGGPYMVILALRRRAMGVA
ncbi:Fe(3+)-hydroxamate ABC transporter permease FhuB [Paraburkholderia metrosideri]|jgi:ABC-type Fe3+-siderophore transport system permease subunit|nr:Fe(3+)-hydroxamate ABC transporter permease FhuB [Paraburkholderia metrosideri]